MHQAQQNPTPSVVHAYGLDSISNAVSDRVPDSFKATMSSMGYTWLEDGPEGVVFEAPANVPQTPDLLLGLSGLLTMAYMEAGWVDESTGGALVGTVETE